MASRVRCLVRYVTWWALLLFVLRVGGVSHGLDGSGVVTVEALCSVLQLVVFIGSAGPLVFGWCCGLSLIFLGWTGISLFSGSAHQSVS